MTTRARDLERAKRALALAARDPELVSNESVSSVKLALRLAQMHGFTFTGEAMPYALCGAPGEAGIVCGRVEGHLPSHIHSAFDARTDRVVRWQILPPNMPTENVVAAETSVFAQTAGEFVGSVLRTALGASKRRPRRRG